MLDKDLTKRGMMQINARRRKSRTSSTLSKLFRGEMSPLSPSLPLSPPLSSSAVCVDAFQPGRIFFACNWHPSEAALNSRVAIPCLCVAEE